MSTHKELAERLESWMDQNGYSERSVLAHIAAELRAMQPDERFEAHTKAVSEFLNDLYAIMVDPLAEGVRTVQQTCDELRAAALKYRESGIQTPEPVNQQLLDALRDEISEVAALAGTCQKELMERCRCFQCRRERSKAVIATAEAQQAPAGESAKGQEPAERMEILAHESADRAYIAGMKTGWNYACADNKAGFNTNIENRLKDLRDSKRERLGKPCNQVQAATAQEAEPRCANCNGTRRTVKQLGGPGVWYESDYRQMNIPVEWVACPVCKPTEAAPESEAR